MNNLLIRFTFILIFILNEINATTNDNKLNNAEAWLLAHNYQKKGDLENAYKNFLIAAKQNHSSSMISISKILEKNPELSTIENEIEYWYLKAIESNSIEDRDFAINFLSYYYDDTMQKMKNLEFMEKMYNKYNHLEIGCKLSATLYSDKKYIEAFDLAKEIYENNLSLPKWNSCARTLSYLYQDGDGGIAKNIDKAINLLTEYFKYNSDDDITAERIGKLYLVEKNNYEKAKIWYKIASQLNKKNELLYVVDEFIKKQLVYDLKKESAQNLYPYIKKNILSKNIVAFGSSKDYNFLSTRNKSIQIIDGNNLTLIKTLRGWIGKGFDGTTTSMTFDEANKILYATGTISETNLKDNDIIKGFDINTGRVVKILQNTNCYMSSDIHVSNDGKYLLALNNNGNFFNIIDTETNYVLNFSSINSNYINGKIIKDNDDYKVFILDKSNYMNIFSIKKEKIIDRKKMNGKVIGGNKLEILVETRENYFQIFDYSFNLVQNIDLTKNKKYKRVVLSEDNKKLILTASNKIEIFDLNKNKKVSDITFNDEIDYGYIDSYNNLYYESEKGIFLKNLNTNESHSFIYKNTHKLDKLLLENGMLSITYDNKNKRYFDLKNMNILESKQNKIKNRLEGKLHYKIKDQFTVDIYAKNNLLQASITLPSTKINNVNIIDDKYVLIDVGQLYLFNLKGEVIAELQGVSSSLNFVYCSNNYMMLADEDNIIHIWDMRKFKNLEYNGSEFDKNLSKSIFSIFKFNPLELLTDNMVKNEEKDLVKFYLLKKQIILPIASLYIKDEKDWIIYTPEGLFTYGGEGYKLLKYHQNQGLHKEAKIIENDQLFDKFYRPDLIKKILAGEKVDIPMNVKSVILNILPPELRIMINKMLNEKDIELTYQICDAGNGIADPKIIINGQAINPPKSRGISIEKVENTDNKCSIYKSVFTLYPGKSTIELKAYDKEKNISNSSEKLEINTDYKIIEKTKIKNKDVIESNSNSENVTILEKPNLYFLSIAVSDYEDNRFDLKYPVKDVDAVKENFLKKSKSIYENIYTFDLHDNKVNKYNINKKFDDISNKIKMNDTFVLYLAGHGSTKDGKYQFLPYKINDKVSIDDIKENLSKIATYTNKSLVLLDTCYSGAIIDNINDEATKNRLAYDSNINYIVASSSNQVALEGYKDHGVFTYSVLDAFDKNDKLKVQGLADYVSEEVPKITQEKFHFQQVPQYKLNLDFNLAN